MSVAIALPRPLEETALVVAREIAIGLHELDDILKLHSVSEETWALLQASPYFTRVLDDARAEWNSALNTTERVKIKSSALIEEWLPEANRLAHDSQQGLNHRVELMKLIKSLSGMGAAEFTGAGTGERFSVTINIGQDNKLKFEKEVTPKVIEGQAEPSESA